LGLLYAQTPPAAQKQLVCEADGCLYNTDKYQESRGNKKKVTRAGQKSSALPAMVRHRGECVAAVETLSAIESEWVAQSQHTSVYAAVSRLLLFLNDPTPYVPAVIARCPLLLDMHAWRS
jgi:hypothetical protein